MKIFIVEDEPPILRDIKNTVLSYPEDFTVVGTAYTGEEAFAYLKQQGKNIDVVITDIHLPVFDGLELIEKTKEYHKHIRWIILSGYDEFSYAQKAVQLGVDNYLLKPVDEKELHQQLQAIQKEKWLGSFQEQPVARYFQEKEAPPDFQRVGVLCAGSFPAHASFDNVVPVEFWDGFLQSGFLNSLFAEYWVIDGETSSEKYILFLDEAYDRLKEKFTEIAHTAGLPLLLGVHSKRIHSETLLEAIEEIRHHMASYSLFGTSQYLNYPKIKSKKNPLVFSSQEPLFRKMLQEKNLGLLDTQLKTIFATMEEDKTLQEELTSFLHHLLEILHEVYPQYLMGSITFLSHELVMLSPSYVVLRESLISLFQEAFFSAVAENDGQSREDVMRQVEDYILKNYIHSINTTTLAEKFNYTPAYLSKLFREYKGISPIDYVLELRINKAKKLLQESQEIAIQDVAALVGYEDALYFSRVFKQATGETPRSFQTKGN